MNPAENAPQAQENPNNQAQETETQAEEQTDSIESTQSEETSETQEQQGDDMIPKKSYEVVAEKYRKNKAELEKIKQQQEEAAEAKLKEGKKFEELYQKKENELNELKSQYTQEKKLGALKMAGINAKAKDPELLGKLVNLDEIELNEDGNVNSDALQGIIKGIQKEKPFLFGEDSQPSNDNVGNSGGGNPQEGSANPTTMKRSELPIDHAEYKRQKISERIERGELTIIDDLAQNA